jgi:hypothetical protein
MSLITTAIPMMLLQMRIACPMAGKSITDWNPMMLMERTVMKVIQTVIMSVMMPNIITERNPKGPARTIRMAMDGGMVVKYGMVLTPIYTVVTQLRPMFLLAGQLFRESMAAGIILNFRLKTVNMLKSRKNLHGRAT